MANARSFVITKPDGEVSLTVTNGYIDGTVTLASGMAAHSGFARQVRTSPRAKPSHTAHPDGRVVKHRYPRK